MVTNDEVRRLALSFTEAEEKEHFGFPSFAVRKKKFATLRTTERKASLKLSLIDQSVFSDLNPGIIFPVEGGWGRMGFTWVDLKKVRKTVFKDALTSAYCQVAPAKLSSKYKRS